MAKLGAVRFDWDYATSGSNGGVNSLDGEIGILSPAAYQGLVPFGGTVTGPNTVSIPQGNQARADREIDMAHKCGLDYFAFDFYPNAAGYPLSGGSALWTGINDGLKFYLSSSKAGLVKFCLLLISGQQATPNPLTTGNWGPIADQIVTYMSSPHYQLGLAGRPIMYMFDTSAFIAQGGTLAMINTLRSKATTAGLLNPYIGTCTAANGASISVATTESEAATLGLDFLSSYAMHMAGAGSAVSVASYNAMHTSLWNAWVANGTGFGVVPNVNVGWDVRSRVADGFWCEQLPPYSCTSMDFTTLATSQELATRIKSAETFTLANPAICNSEHILIGAWNELSEDGNAMVPHANDKGMNLQLMARELRRQRESARNLRARGLDIYSR
jgi:hypothetical protein